MTMQRRRWSDLSPAQQYATVALGAIEVGLLAAALIDIRRRPQWAIRGPKGLWAAVSFINIAGPLAYFTFGRRM